ncbi:DUF3801 domain-containing protein [Enterococcus olivae]
MANIDENVEVGIELTTTTIRLGAKVLIATMDYFLNLDKEEKVYQDLTTKQGKQKVKNLFEKNQNSGVEALGSNVSKNELTAFNKELKSMGVDFAPKKIGKDSYSLFFAGKDREAIEAGLRNAIEKYAIKETKKQNIAEKKEKPQFKIKELQEQARELKKEQKQVKVRNKKQTQKL